MPDLRRSLRGVKPAVWSLCSRRPLVDVITWHGPRDSRAVALTFDDGPHPDYTPRVLDILRRYGATATFFVLGKRVERYPELVRDIGRAGHEIGIHGWDHTRKDLPEQTVRTQQALASLGVATDLFRPPGGDWTVPVIVWAVRQGIRTVMWSRDSYDSPRHANAGSIDDLCGTTRGGDIVLLHDDNPACIDGLPRVLEDMRSRALVARAVSEVLRR